MQDQPAPAQTDPKQDKTSSSGRFGFSLTPALREFLQQTEHGAAVLQELLADQNSTSSSSSSQEAGGAAAAAGPPVVPWRVLQEASRQQQQQQRQQQQQQQQPPDTPHGSSTNSSSPSQPPAAGGVGPSTAALVSGCSLVLPGPRPRQRSKALQQRLAALQERLDAAAYAAMVSDVTPDEAAAAAAREEPFLPTTRLQLSFGLHVVVTMGTFFALGWYGGRLLAHSQTWAALCGCVGLLCGLLLETALLILRLNGPPPLDQTYAHLLDKSWQTSSKQQQQRQRQRGPVHGGAVKAGVRRAAGQKRS